MMDPMTTKKPADPRVGVPGANLDRGRSPVRGVRVDDDLWNEFGWKAEEAGKSRSAVILALLRGYVDGSLQPLEADSDKPSTED